jgi:hypothetical protein
MIKHAVVVDATGRANRGPVRLGELGFPPPAEERVDTRLIYATAQYARHPDDGDVYGSVIGATTAAPRGGASIAVEDRRWMVALFGMGNDAPPVDGPGFEEFAGRFFRAAAALAEVRGSCAAARTCASRPLRAVARSGPGYSTGTWPGCTPPHTMMPGWARPSWRWPTSANPRPRCSPRRCCPG